MERAVVVIDMINEFVYGKFGGERARSVIPCIKKLLSYAKENSIPVIFLMDAHEEGDVELEVWGEHAMKGTEGSQIISDLTPNPDDYVLEKSRYSSFHDTGLEGLLKGLGVNELILVGVTTDICVRHSAADAFFHGFKVIIPRDCVNTISDELQERSLKDMTDLYKAKIVDLEQVID
jgi:nicotinamidase-related amidase